MIISVLYLGLKYMTSMKFIIYPLKCIFTFINSYIMSLFQQYPGDDIPSELE